MIIGELIRKWFGIQRPECDSCEIYREQLRLAREEKDEYYQRLLAVMRVSDEKVGTAINIPSNFKSIGGIVDWRKRQADLQKAFEKVPGNKVKEEWDEQIKKVEETLGSVQSGSEAKEN